MTKKKLKLNWNKPKRTNIEYSDNKNTVIENELNSRKYNYSFKISLDDPFNMVYELRCWDRDIKQKKFRNGFPCKPYPDNTVFKEQNQDIEELKKIAQDFINKEFKEN